MRIEKIIIRDRRAFTIKDKLKLLKCSWSAADKVWYWDYPLLSGKLLAAVQKSVIAMKKAGFNIEVVLEKEPEGTFEFDNLTKGEK